jgi:hypothetical protein
LNFLFWSFEFVSNFDIRISDFASRFDDFDAFGVEVVEVG